MAKNLNYRAPSASHKKGSYSHESSPLHTYKTKKDTSNCFQPSELDTNLRLSSKAAIKKTESRPLTANVFINNLNVQINSSQANQKKMAVPLSASITNRKNSKQYSALTQKEEAALAAFREGKSKQKIKSVHSSLEDAMSSSITGGMSYDLRKNPMALVSRHNSEASNDLARSSYIPKFKGSDPSNKFALRSPPKVFSQGESALVSTATAAKFKKPNTRGTQKSFDVNAGGPLGKYTPYLNTYLKPPTTANNSPKNKDSDAKFGETELVGRGASSNSVPKQVKSPLEKGVLASKATAKSTVAMAKHRKTPSFDHTKRSESIAQKTLTPPILDRMRKSADCGDYWQQDSYSNKTSFQFAIRTRAGVAPNGTRKINQDSFVFHTNYGKKSDRYLLGVCDGHGMNGHLVSGFVKEALPVYLLADPSFETDLHHAMTNAFELCHQKLLVGDVDCRFSGTTTAIVMIDGNKVITANAGDSRAVIGSYGNKGWDYTPITFDHKPDSPQEAHRIIKSGGRIEPFKDGEGNFVGPSRVWLSTQDIPGLAMSRSIGDFVAQSVGVSCIPEIKEFSINPNDRFMIVASDGVWEFIENIDVVKIIAPFYEQNNIEGACDFLLGVALRRWQEEEEVVVDDITLIIVFF